MRALPLLAFTAVTFHTGTSGLFNSDHRISDALEGPCWIAGVTKNHPDVNDFVYFDHQPHVCALTLSP